MESIIQGFKHLLTVLAGVSLLSAPTVKPSPNPSIIPPKPQIKSNQPIKPDFETISGNYSYLGQDLHYKAGFPKDGGEVTGEVNGLCNGSTHGIFGGGEGGKIEGKLSADCGIGFIRQKVGVSYNGKLYPQKRLMEINWEGEIPYFGDHGSFSYNY